MKKYRFMISLLMLIAITSSLCACSSSGSSKDASKEASMESIVEAMVEAQEEGPKEKTAEDVEAMIQGEWSAGGGTMTFTSGHLVILSQGVKMDCTYEIDTANSNIVATFQTSDRGEGKINIPYEFEGDEIILKNNAGQNLTRQ